MVETITTINLSALSNPLFVQFMADVDFQVQRVTPEALKIRKCYASFSAAGELVDAAFLMQQKDNETANSDAKDVWRDEIYRCFSGHVSADLTSSVPAKREHARVVRNKIDSYGYLPSLGNNAESAKMSDLGKDLQTSPLKESVEALGMTDEVVAMVAANNDYVALARGRVESRKLTTENMKSARNRQGDAYRQMISLVNSQVTVNSLIDEEEGERPGELSVLSDELDPLTDFVLSMNALIKEYKTKIAQSGTHKVDPERPGEL